MFENLKALRKSKKMTQAEFANSIGIPPTTYSGYEKGEREPRSDFWTQVADKYEVTVDYLIGYCDRPHGTKYGDSFQIDAEEESLVTAWRSADERAKEDVAHALRNFGFDYSEEKKKDETA